jgi:flagellar biogenesis protein FliO
VSKKGDLTMKTLAMIKEVYTQSNKMELVGDLIGALALVTIVFAWMVYAVAFGG